VRGDPAEVALLLQDRPARRFEDGVELAGQFAVLALDDALHDHREVPVDLPVAGVLERDPRRLDVDHGEQLLRQVMERALDEPGAGALDLPAVPPSAALPFDLAEYGVDPGLEGVADGLLDRPRGDDRP
jgi:hypothetical protein